MLRDVGGNVDAGLGHDFDGQRMDAARGLGPCRTDCEGAVERLQETVRHLTAAAVADAQYEYSHFQPNRTLNK